MNKNLPNGSQIVYVPDHSCGNSAILSVIGNVGQNVIARCIVAVSCKGCEQCGGAAFPAWMERGDVVEFETGELVYKLAQYIAKTEVRRISARKPPKR